MATTNHAARQPWFGILAVHFFLFQATLAKLRFTNIMFWLTINEPFNVTWTGASGPVTFSFVDVQFFETSWEVFPLNDGFYLFTQFPNSIESDTYLYEFVLQDELDTVLSPEMLIHPYATHISGEPSPTSISTRFTPLSDPFLHTITLKTFESTLSTPTSSSESSLSALTTKVKPSLSASKATSQSSFPAPTGLSNDKDNDGIGSGGLSNSGKIGMGVGVGIGALFLLSLVAYFFYRRGKAAGAKAIGSRINDGNGWPAGKSLPEPGDMPRPELDAETGVKSVSSMPVSELEASYSPVQMAGYGGIYGHSPEGRLD